MVLHQGVADQKDVFNLSSWVLQMRQDVKFWSNVVPTAKYSSAIITSNVNGNAHYIMLYNDASWLRYLAHFPHYEMVLLIMYLMSEKGDKLRWNTVWVLTLSCTLPKNIDPHFTFHCIASCCALINQYGGFLWWQMHLGLAVNSAFFIFDNITPLDHNIASQLSA